VAEALEVSGATRVIDFSASINPLGPPGGLREVAVRALGELDCYPDDRYPGFCRAAGGFLGVPAGCVVPANGSTEVIRLFAEAVLEEGDRFVVPSPAYCEYEYAGRLRGAEPVRVDWRQVTELGLDELSRVKAVFLGNPNNPTGDLYDIGSLERLAGRCQEAGTYLLVDEAFLELSSGGESLARFAVETEFVVVSRSLTKDFAVPGLRVGFAVAGPGMSRLLWKLKPPWNLNGLAAKIGAWLLETGKPFLEESRNFIKNERAWLTSRLSSYYGFQVHPSQSNFFLVELEDFLLDSTALRDRLLENGVLIRDCSSFPGCDRRFVRIAVRRREENEKLLSALEKVIAGRGVEMARESLEAALQSGRTRSRIDCEYYPCHFEGQDCTFCFCPFYPCLDTTLGEMKKRPSGEEVWSCQKCHLVHQPEVAEEILKAMLQGVRLEEIWESLQKKRGGLIDN